MPIPKAIARLNLVLTNPILRHVAWWAPGFAMVTHVGRTSGRVRRTPVNIFAHGRDYVIALTYGRDSEWVKNVQAAGGASSRRAAGTFAWSTLRSSTTRPAR